MTSYESKTGAISARTTAFGNLVDTDRALADLPHLSLVLVDLPEYSRNGLGRALMKVVRYHFQDIDTFGCEGMSIGADTSRGMMIYEDMNPIIVGQSHDEAQAKFNVSAEVIKALYQRKLPIELVTLAALRAGEFATTEQLVEFVEMYHARASWMELHPVEVRFQNIEAEMGDKATFDWARLLPAPSAE